jgi:hypothetical protein
MAQEDGFTKGVSLADGATLERAITINHWHTQHGGMYKQYFAKGFKAGRMNKVNHNNKQYNLNLKLMKDGSIRHGEQGMAEATGDEKFDTMMSQMQREPKYPDSQMPPTDVKDLYQWAVKNNKPYHKIFATWANREGYKSVAPALQRAGNLDTEALDYWTPNVWKIYWGELNGIDSEMPPEWAKKRVPDELRDYLDTVFDAYDRIVFDWPTEYRQIGEQGMAEAKDDYVPPREANYDDKYQAMVKRVGEKAKQQEKARQQQQPKAPVRESRLALLKQIIQS